MLLLRLNKILLLLGLLYCCTIVLAQDIPLREAPKVYPTNWWVGMKNPDLQLMVHGLGIGKDAKVEVVYPGVQLMKVQPGDNPNYLFIDLRITASALPGTVSVRISNKDGGKPVVIPYALQKRREGKGSQFAQGVTSSDFIYLLMPDRFSNGDTTNDRIAGMRDQSLNRDSIYLRHGGDIQGVINHLDYLQGLGVTTLWMTPVLVNDMPDRTEHGYAFTDHYTIDPRLGGAVMYKRLSDELHRRGMKLIQDAVYNHVGLYHLFVQDQPFKDWLHQWPAFTQTSYKDQPLMDPYAAAMDKKITVDGWFTRQMPDLNQGNPYEAQFLIQHALWSVETFGVDGWRIDTYLYNDLDFMNRCNKALTDEYPHMTMFGETWVHGTVSQAFFADNNIQGVAKSNLQGVTDFQCNFSGIVPALTEQFGWTSGVNTLYTTLSNDFLYKDPMRNVIFLDNHDLTRFFSAVGEDVAKQKIGIEWLFTCRGIPQMYYGTEVLMKGVTNPDGWVRLDFPGGWVGDRKNAFTGDNLTADELTVQGLVKKLGLFRRSSSALCTGRMMQYVPKDGLYVYFRYDVHETIMCMMNTADHDQSVDCSAYTERVSGFTKARDILTGNIYPISEKIVIPGMTMKILELER